MLEIKTNDPEHLPAGVSGVRMRQGIQGKSSDPQGDRAGCGRVKGEQTLSEREAARI